MRIGFVTNVTATANLEVMRRLASSSRVDLQHVYFYDTLSDSRKSLAQVIRQFGWRRLATKLVALLASRCRLVAAKFRGASSFEAKSCFEYAKVQKLPYSVIKDFNSEEAVEHVQQQGFDVVVVCVCKSIFKGPLLSVPGTQFVNIHPSMLPSYRGPTPTFWMLYYGEEETGVSIHRMTTRIDVGEVLFQQSMPLDRNKIETEIEADLFQIAANAIEDVLLQLSLKRAEQNVAPRAELGKPSGSYHSYPTPEQRAELVRMLSDR